MSFIQNNANTLLKHENTILKHDGTIVGLGTIVVLVRDGMDGALVNAFVELVTPGGTRVQVTPNTGTVTFDSVPLGYFLLRATSGSAQLQLIGNVVSESPLQKLFTF
ncbi:MAG: hypothetical protein HYZ54_01650 [Ignavibacteriae bacterium]|nr:hypothetical protein [Ignavibacteriota bacterium]